MNSSLKWKKEFLSQFCFVVSEIAIGLMLLATPARALATTSMSDDPVTEAQAASIDASSLTARERENLQQFHEPVEMANAFTDEAARFARGQSIPKNLLAKALAYYHENYSSIENHTYLAVVDLSARSSEKRMHILNMKTGTVVHLHVAHGSGSDPNNDGFATVFSNTFDSEMSSLGFYKTAEIYSGAHGRSLRLDGLSSSNSNVRERAVVIHGADYVREANVKAGRSWGCFAVAMAQRNKVINLLKGGAIIYAGRGN